MTTRVKVDLEGFGEYLEKLAQAGRDVDAAAGRALRAGAEVAQAGMVRRVRKDTHNLQEHITVGPVQQDGNYVFVEVGVLHADADTARYGNAQEYSTATESATPYIRPTMVEDRGKINAAMRESLKGEGVVE